MSTEQLCPACGEPLVALCGLGQEIIGYVCEHCSSPSQPVAVLPRHMGETALRDAQIRDRAVREFNLDLRELVRQSRVALEPRPGYKPRRDQCVEILRCIVALVEKADREMADWHGEQEEVLV